MLISVLKSLHGDDYAVHQTVKKIFGSRKILYQRRAKTVHVLHEAPRAGGKPGKDISWVVKNIQEGDLFDFQLRINPVVSRLTQGKKRGTLKPVPSDQLEHWLNQKFIKHGFLADFICEEEGYRKSNKKGHTISLNSVMVRGTLKVVSASYVKSALTGGIGRGKGLGFGLLHIYDSYLAA